MQRHKCSKCVMCTNPLQHLRGLSFGPPDECIFPVIPVAREPATTPTTRDNEDDDRYALLPNLFPDEILFVIFGALDARDLVSLAFTCRAGHRWRKIMFPVMMTSQHKGHVAQVIQGPWVRRLFVDLTWHRMFPGSSVSSGLPTAVGFLPNLSSVECVSFGGRELTVLDSETIFFISVLVRQRNLKSIQFRLCHVSVLTDMIQTFSVMRPTVKTLRIIDSPAILHAFVESAQCGPNALSHLGFTTGDHDKLPRYRDFAHCQQLTDLTVYGNVRLSEAQIQHRFPHRYTDLQVSYYDLDK